MKLIRLSDIPLRLSRGLPTSPRTVAAYLRLWVLRVILSGPGRRPKTWRKLTDLSMSMRYDHEPHPTYLDELRQRFRPSKMRAKG